MFPIKAVCIFQTAYVTHLFQSTGITCVQNKETTTA